MKTIIYTLFFCLSFLSNISYSQSGWIQQQSGVHITLHSIFFVNSNTGWVCGDSGKILKTTNKGSNWILQNSSTAYPLRSVFFLNENTGWCCGGTRDFNLYINRMIVVKTTNGGNLWETSFYSPTFYSCFASIYFINEMNGYAVENGGTGSGPVAGLWKSTNGGFNWQYAQYDIPAFGKLQFTDPNTGWVTGFVGSDVGLDTGYIFKSINGGSYWFNVYQKSKMFFFSSYFLNNNTGWFSGRDNENFQNISFLMKTTNGGLNFDRINLENYMYFNSIIFKNSNIGWGCNTKIYKTTNSGTNWILQLNNPADEYNSILFLDTLIGWAVGFNGVIFSTITGGINSVSIINKDFLQTYSLSQNYPNPFNPKTIIHYTITPRNLNFEKGGTSGLVQLKVYNILGNEVATLVNEKQNTGSYSVEFDATNLLSGIYFYTLRAGDFIETKRMILLK